MSVSSNSMMNYPKDSDNDVKEDNPVNGAKKNNADEDIKKDKNKDDVTEESPNHDAKMVDDVTKDIKIKTIQHCFSDSTSAIINQPKIKQPGTSDRAYIREDTTGQLNTKVRILLFFMLIMIEMFFFVFQGAVFPSRDVRIKPSVTKQRKQGFISEFELSRKVNFEMYLSIILSNNCSDTWST